MFKALLKKQLKEFTTANGRNKRSKKASVKGIVIAYSVIFVCLSLFFTFLALICSTEMLGNGNDWTFYTFIGIISLTLSIFINVLSTYGGLYLSKDNDLLLSLPIPPSHIVISRILTTYLLGLFFTISTFAPAIIVGWIFRPVTFASIIMPLLILIFSSLFVLSFTCLIGWLIALISSKLKNKSYVTAGVAALFIVGYIFFANNLIRDLRVYLLDTGQNESIFKSWWNPFYLIGEGAAGGVLSLLIFAGITLAILCLIIFAITKSFYNIISSAKSRQSKEIKSKGVGGQKSVNSALLKKEFLHYFKCSVYMINTGIGEIILVALTIFMMVKLSDLSSAIPELEAILPEIVGIVPMGIAIFAGLISSISGVSVSSVSLEGDRLWVLKSLPVESKKILNSKRNLHLLIVGIPTVLCVAILDIFFRMNIISTILSILFILFFIILQANIGLILDLKKPHLVWTSEVYPVKQNLNVLFNMLIGIGMSIVFAAVVLFGIQFIGVIASSLAAVLLAALLCFITQMWVSKKGSIIFDTL